MGIQRLPKVVSANIVSTSSVQSQISVIKELIENAIDAINGYNNCDEDSGNGQIYIEVDKESAGLDYISVKDNGLGIDKIDRNIMCLNCTTSKLASIDDLSKGVNTCGFRGEALNFIARLSGNMQISTKTKNDMMLETWSVSKSGLPNQDTKCSPGLVGTTVKVTGLFCETPVRQNFLKQRKTKMLKELEDLIITYSLIHRNIRFQLRYVKALKSGKVINGENKIFANKISREQLFYDIMDIHKKNWLYESSFNFAIQDSSHNKTSISVFLLLPKMRAQDIPIYKHSIKILTVNNRPLDLSLKFGKAILNKVNESYAENLLIIPPVWYIALSIPPDKIDVNIEPEKSDVIMGNEENLFKMFQLELSKIIKLQHNSNSEYSKNTICETSLEENSSNNQVKEDSVTDPPIILQNVNDNLFVSDDDEFIQELDSTIQNIKDRYNKECKVMSINNFRKKEDGLPADDDLNNDDITKNDDMESVENDCKLSQNHVVNNEDDWSHTVYDNTTISSEFDSLEQDLTTIDEVKSDKLAHSHISISNPWTITKLANEIKECAEEREEPRPVSTETETNLNGEKNLDSIKMTPTSQKSVSNENYKKKINSVKQMAFPSYVTYHIDDPKKKRISNDQELAKIKTPKIADCVQDIFDEKIAVAFEFTFDKDKRHDHLIRDELWVNRTGIPSSHITEGALNLYDRLSHVFADSTPILNDCGIYEIK